MSEDILNQYINKYSTLLATPEVETEEEKRRREEKERLEAMQQEIVVSQEPLEVDDTDIPDNEVDFNPDKQIEEAVSPVQITEPQPKPIESKGSDYYLNLYASKIISGQIDETALEEKPTTAQLTELGVKLEKTTIGNLFNLAKAGVLSIGNSDSFQENIQAIEKERTDKIFKQIEEKYGTDFRQYENDLAVMGGRAVVAFADPVTFFVPWAKIAKVGKLGASGIGAGIASADMALYEYATHGEVSPNNVLFAAGLGGASSFAGTLLNNKLYGPKDKNINLGKVDDSVEDVIVKSSAKDEAVVKLTLKESEDLDDVTLKIASQNNALIKEMESSVHLKSMLDKANKDIYNFRQAEKLVNKSFDETGYNSKNKLDLFPVTKSEVYKFAGISPQKYTALKKKFNDANFFKSEQLPELLMKVSKGQVKLLDDTLIRLAKTPNYELTENLMTGVLQNFTRPLLGSGIGFAIGTFVGDEDEDTLPISFMLAGAGLGAAQRAIQKNSYITEAMKESGTAYLKNAQMITLHNFLKTSTAGGLTTRNIAHGGENETLARMLFHVQDGKQKNIIGAEQASDAMAGYFYKRVGEIIGNTSLHEQRAAFRIIRELDTEENIIKQFTLNSDEITNVRTLLKNVDVFKKEFGQDYSRSAGVNFGNIANYGLPQFYNQKIITDPTGFKKAIKEAVKEESSEALARLKSKKGVKEHNRILNERVKDIFDNMTGRGAKNIFGDDEKFTGIPFLKNFEKKRYFKKLKAVKKLEPYLEDNIHNVLNTWVQNGTRGIEFARKFGQRGEMLVTLKQGLKNKLRNGEISEQQYIDKRNLLLNSTNAYFKTYGITKGLHDAHKTGMALLTFLSNTTMLPRAAIAQLGDFIQPFQNSSLGAASKAMLAGLKKDTNYAYQLGIARGKSTTLEKDVEALYSAAVNPLNKLQSDLGEATRFFFKYNGMAPLTDKGARFAFNTGIIDAFDMAKKYANVTKISRPINSKMKQMGLNKDELKVLNNFTSIEKAFEDEKALGILLKAGNKIKDRDVGVPTAGNRMLFAQSQNPYVRSLGLFLSWSQFKSAQLNSLVNRVEDGDVKLALKMLGAVTVFGGVRELQIMASPSQKYYEEHEPDNFGPKWWQEASSLAGVIDWRIEKFARFFAGPSQQSPVLNLTPVLSEADALFKAPVKVYRNLDEGDYEGALIQAVKPTPFREVVNVYNRVAEEPLEDKPKEEEVKVDIKAGFSTGGIVRQQYVTGKKVSEDYPVSYAKKNPSDREDTFTGQPYSAQMEELELDVFQER